MATSMRCLASPNLKQWTKLCDLPDFGNSECPDFLELPVMSGSPPESPNGSLWGANNNYLIGKFDGA